MNINEFFEKLYKDSNTKSIMTNKIKTIITVDIDTIDLVDNMDLLAKELHMEVEREALTVKHKLGRERHKEIRVKDIDFLEE